MVWLVYLLGVLIFGSTWVAMKIGLKAMPPFTAAAARSILAFAVFFVAFRLWRFRFPPIRHIRRDFVLAGLMLYGISPFPGEAAASLGLRPVMQFISAIIAINPVSRGEAVGYGGAWVCKNDTVIGVVAAGYADGYPRHAPSGTAVLVNNRPAPLVGRVSMDMLCVDLTDHPEVRIGDPALLWGGSLPVEEVAAAAGTIPYELLCHIAPRVTIEERG